jgi:hypothetical protein
MTIKNDKYLIYNAHNCKFLSEFLVEKDFLKFSQNQILSIPIQHITINPEGSYITLYYLLKNHTLLIHHNILTNKTTYNKQRMPKDYVNYNSQLIENKVLFGIRVNKKTYYDVQFEMPYWYDYKTDKISYYKQPVLQFSDSKWGYTGELVSYDSIIDLKNITFTTCKNKNGKEKVVSKSTNIFPELNSNTYRFGTKLMIGQNFSEYYNGIYDFNLINLQLNKIHNFNNYTTIVKSNLFINSIKFNNSSFLDSIASLDIKRELTLIHIQDSTKIIYADRENGGFLFYNSLKNKKVDKIVYFKLFKTDEWILYSDDKYYACYFSNEPIFQFYLDGKSHPFEQFDLKYNRPDIILDRLGYADSSLVKAYHQAYLKRLKKMNFTEDMLKDDFHLPELKIENFEKMPTIIDGDELDLNLNIKDTKYPLDRINVWINDVAIYGTQGIDIRDKQVQEYKANLNLKLAKGNNKIQVSVLNQAGAESYKETFTVNCKAGKEKPNLVCCCYWCKHF